MKQINILAMTIVATTFLLACTTDVNTDTDDDDNKDAADDEESGERRDSSSDLSWKTSPAPNKMTWQEAIDYCEGLSGDWRLPTISELRSLIRDCDATQKDGWCGVSDDCLDWDYCWNDACVGCEYNKGPANGCYWPNEIEGDCAGWYWSSSSYAHIAAYAWHIYFNGADINGYNKTDKGYARCVRSGI